MSEITKGTKAEIVTFGETQEADCYAKNISFDDFGNGIDDENFELSNVTII